jgi:hypothetical protein
LTAAQAGEPANAIERGIGTGTSEEVAPVVSEKLTKLLVLPSTSALFRCDPITIPAKTIDDWRGLMSYARRGGFSIHF